MAQTMGQKMSPEQMRELQALFNKSNNAEDIDIIAQQREEVLQDKVKNLEKRKKE